MSHGTRIRVPIHLQLAFCALIVLFAFTLGAAPAKAEGPNFSGSGPNITVQIEGLDGTVVEKRQVSLDYNKFSPPPPWPGSSAPANSIAAAIETALNDTYGAPPVGGWWDRSNFVSTIKSETLIWPQYWAFFTNNIYGNKGAMDGGDQWGLDYGDNLLISGGGSVGEWPDPSRPAKLPVDLNGTGIDSAAAVPVNTPFPVEVQAWMPQNEDTDMPPGPSERQRASWPIPGEDFTVVAMPAGTVYNSDTVGDVELGTATTNAQGEAEMTIEQTGEVLVKAVRENETASFGGSPLGEQGRSPAHQVCVYNLNSGDCDTPVFNPASSLDVGEATVNGVGAPASLQVGAPNAPNTVTGVRVFGPDASDFLVSAGNCVDELVAEGASCLITVRLAPTATGARSATLRVKSDSESLPRDIALTGTGVEPGPTPPTGSARLNLSVSPAKRRVRRGGKVTVTVRVTNTGDAVAGDVIACLRPPNGFNVGRLCRKRVSLAASSEATFTYNVRANRKAALGKFRNVQIRATANGLPLTTRQIRLAARR